MQCECATDGFCKRYGREMYGRSRELCQGINVDIGTAASFREAWKREAPQSLATEAPERKLLLKTRQAPGDAVAMTAAIYSLHRTHPGRFLTAVESSHPEVFLGNPDVSPGGADWEPLEMHYPSIHESNSRGIHFMQGWCEFLSFVLEVPVPLITNRPRLYGYAVEASDYWIVCSGGKSDFTNKIWHRYQEVIGAVPVRWVQVGVNQEPLRGVESLVGETSLRELFALVAGARGVLCGVSLLMHVAAAFEKPAVIIAGGREPVAWNAYPKQHYLHTIGELSCCKDTACWKSRLVPLGDWDKDVCERPTPVGPECMTKITPSQVASLIRRLEQSLPVRS